jgi:hypothetical protein
MLLWPTTDLTFEENILGTRFVGCVSVSGITDSIRKYEIYVEHV